MEIYLIDSLVNSDYFDYTKNPPEPKKPQLKKIYDINKENKNVHFNFLRADDEIFKDLKKEYLKAYLRVKNKPDLYSDLLRFYFAYKYEKDEDALYIDSDVLVFSYFKCLENDNYLFFKGTGILKLNKKYKEYYKMFLDDIQNYAYIDDMTLIKKSNKLLKMYSNDEPKGLFHCSERVNINYKKDPRIIGILI